MLTKIAIFTLLLVSIIAIALAVISIAEYYRGRNR